MPGRAARTGWRRSVISWRLSDIVDKSTAQLLRREVSDGVIAPGFSDEALAILRKKQGGKYLLIQMDADYEAPESEAREVYGVTFEQRRNDARLTLELLQNRADSQ